MGVGVNTVQGWAGIESTTVAVSVFDVLVNRKVGPASLCPVVTSGAANQYSLHEALPATIVLVPAGLGVVISFSVIPLKTNDVILASSLSPILDEKGTTYAK